MSGERVQCFKNKIKKKPAPNTIRARILALSDHLRVEKREGKKRAAEKYEPIKGHFPGADRPLAVGIFSRLAKPQAGHTPFTTKLSMCDWADTLRPRSIWLV